MAHSASAPKTTARAPSTIAVICMLAPNQSVNWLRGDPWRSSSGTTSMVRRSGARLISGGPSCVMALFSL